LFPFLAVLLCAMGALIVILVVIAHRARAAAIAKAVEEQQLPSEETAAAADDSQAAQRAAALEWEVEQLAQSRASTLADLERKQQQLSHLEEHQRRLKDEVERIVAASREMAEVANGRAAQRQQVEENLARVERRIVELTGEVERLRREAKSKKTSYAILPYEGPSGTRRRPLFIECREDAVILQPEGIHLEPSDFQQPLGPGNPLASAMRASREYLAEVHGRNSQAGRPYPLMLVRPDGIMAYYKVRQALESWGPDFGYELIGDDWDLKFPQSNVHLAEVQLRAIAQGRRLQARLRATMPGPTQPQGTFRASRMGGGFVRVGGRGGSSFGGGQGDSFGDPASFREGGAEPGEDSFGGGSAADRYASADKGSPSESGTSSGGRHGSNSSTHDPHDRDQSAAGHPSQVAQDTNAGFGGQHGRDGGEPSQTPGGSPDGPSGAVATGGNRFTASGSDSGQRSQAGQSAASGSPNAGAANQAAGGASLAMGSAEGEPGRQSGFGRPRNWALRDAGPQSVAVTRSVRVVCHADRLVLVPDDRQAAGKVVPLTPRTADSVDRFVGALQEEMAGWGIAGNGLYWQPMLLLDVAPGGSVRAADLTRLLAGSGILIRPAQSANRQQRQPQ